MAASLIVYGYILKDTSRLNRGLSLLDSIIERWDDNSKSPVFHSDFNNFALCVVSDFIKDDYIDIYQRIQEIVINTNDSKHNTINWLPMRWYVNKKRFEWSNDAKYKRICQECSKIIKEATNSDGGIEDRLPKGVSFNLQYDIATVGVLQFLRTKGVELDLSNQLSFLLKVVAPDGDVNYQGRGTNQIFAWGLWVYLLASSGKTSALEQAIDYLSPRVLKMFQNQNLMLNSLKGSSKTLWWDYHYCSVYSAHFLFWLLLAIKDFDSYKISDSIDTPLSDTGLHIVKTPDYFVASFNGRKEYLAESGPLVCAIWTKKNGVVCKGTFGPWLGDFGQKYSNEAVLRNFCGIVELKTLFNINKTRVGKCLSRYGLRLKTHHVPRLAPVYVKHDKEFELVYSLSEQITGFFNIPISEGAINNICLNLRVDNKNVTMEEVAIIKNQYGNMHLFQSGIISGKEWSLTID